MENRIKQYRNERNMTQKQLGDKAGITENQAGYIERGVHTPSVKTALALASALGVAVEDLFSKEPAA